jgi:hypothetical protein
MKKQVMQDLFVEDVVFPVQHSANGGGATRSMVLKACRA